MEIHRPHRGDGASARAGGGRHGTADSSLDSAVIKSVRTRLERTFEQDPALAFRVLVDIALRARVGGHQRPDHGRQVLDSLEGLLRVLVGRDLDVGVVTGQRGNARVLLPLPVGPTTSLCRSTGSSTWAPVTRRSGGASSACFGTVLDWRPGTPESRQAPLEGLTRGRLRPAWSADDSPGV